MAQSIVLGMDIDEASGAVKQERRKPQLKAKQSLRRDSVQSASSTSSSSPRARKNSRGAVPGKDYQVQGEGNNIKARQISQGSASSTSRRGSSNPLGIGFTQSGNFQQQLYEQHQRGSIGGGGGGGVAGVENEEVENYEQTTPSRMQVRLRRDSFIPGSASSQKRRSSLEGQQQQQGQGGATVKGNKRQIVLKQKNRDEKGELTPVGKPTPDLFKAMRDSGGSLSGESRPSSRSSHSSRCFKDQYDSKNDLIVNSSHHDNGGKIGATAIQPRKRNNIFFASRFTKHRRNSQQAEEEDVTPSMAALRSPSPPLAFPKFELAALKMMSMTSRSSFSYYQTVPMQYKKHNQFVRNRAMNVGKRTAKSPRKKIK